MEEFLLVNKSEHVMVCRRQNVTAASPAADEDAQRDGRARTSGAVSRDHGGDVRTRSSNFLLKM